MNFMLFGSHISMSGYVNSLLLVIDYSHPSFKYILHDMMLIGSQTRKVGHDLNFKFILSDISYCKMYVIMNLIHMASQISRS